MPRGHLRQRYNKSWSIKITVVDEFGNRKAKWFTSKDPRRSVAEQKLTELLHQYDTNTLPNDNRITLGDYLKRWLIAYTPTLSPNSLKRYTGIINTHLTPALGKIPLSKLRLLQIQNYYNEKTKTQAPNSVRYHHAVLHKALETAITWQLLTRNPSHGAIIPPKARPSFDTWSMEELNAFLKFAVISPYYVMFHTALHTGLRRSELLGLRWRDLELTPGRIHVSQSLHKVTRKGYYFKETKSKHGRRSVPLPASSIAVLQKFKDDTVSGLLLNGLTFKDDRLVFCHEDGSPYSPNFITNRWNELVKDSGLKRIRLHDARHTYATLLLEANVNLKVVQELLGHATIQETADTYSHVTPTIQEQTGVKFNDIFR